ncbi:MAG TPA: riboflavin synthase [Gemmatimonadales bacterium]|nr:riboflavin synthase [Gemmatimonadales bacterium]
MFTGIVSAVGVVTKTSGSRSARAPHPLAPSPSGRGGTNGGTVLEIKAPLRNVKRGESVAINGACLTVERIVKGGFTVRAVDTTLDRTLFGEYAAGRKVNLERAVRAGEPLGGHLVQGHVDGVATVEYVRTRGDAVLVGLRVPVDVRDVCIPKGSITVDGVSLTVDDLPGGAVVQVSLIPFTREHTTLGALEPGARVHVEGDVIGKYVRQLCRSER